MGPKNLLSFALILNIIGSILTPFLAFYFKTYILISAVRLIMGFGYGMHLWCLRTYSSPSGFMIPAGSVLISKWFPISEKSTAMAIFTTGNQIGIAVSMFLTAKMCQVPFFEGWPLVFIVYGSRVCKCAPPNHLVSGLIGLIFLIIWHVRVADKPRESKYITATELTYIKGGKPRRSRAETLVRPTPYKRVSRKCALPCWHFLNFQIILNGCVCAICVCSFAQSYVLVALVTYLPKYNQIAMKMNLTHVR